MPRLAYLSGLWLAAWSGSAAADAPAPAAGPTPPVTIDANETLEKPPGHPVYGVVTLGADLGTNYAGDARLSLFASPSPRVSLGGSLFVAPLTSFPQSCVQPCSSNAVLMRAMAELRFGTSFTSYRRSLGWLGVGAGVAYLPDAKMDPGPSLAVSVGGDVRLTDSLWFELSPRFAWEYLPGPATTLAGNYFTIGLDLGVRLDFTR